VRIALVFPRFHTRGGIERYLHRLAGELSRQHEVTLVVGSVEAEPPEGCRVIRVPFLPRPFWLAPISFSVMSWLRLRGLTFDIVNVHGASSFTQDVVTAHSCHRAWFRTSRAELMPLSRRWWLKVLNPIHYFTILTERIQFRRAGFRRVISVSRSVQRELTEQYGLPEDTIQVIHSGVDGNEFNPSNRSRHRAVVRARWGIGEHDLLLLFLGNEFRRKGLAVTLEALAGSGLSEAKLLVVGADEPAPYRRIAETLGVSDRVVFAGATSDAAPFYAAADVFVMPTRYEAFPLVVLEAMASGLPVVTTRTAGAAELIEDGVDGYLLDDPSDPGVLADQLRGLRNAAERERCGAQARARVEPFTWERVAGETIAVFAGLGPAPARPEARRSREAL
jgi:UDP-glucose:(heptosyl)LPS alpha-1,3-glucosyltransferase